MQGRIWQIRSIDTNGRDLVLSRIAPWALSGLVVPISVRSSVSPVSGSLENLLDDDDSLCEFSSATVLQPGFFIELEFDSVVSLLGFRFAGPDQSKWPVRHALIAEGKCCDIKALRWLSGELSPEPTLTPFTAMPGGDVVHYSEAGSRLWRQIGLSANGATILAAAYSANSSARLWLSKDYGASWVDQAAAGSRNWEFCAASHDGLVLVGALGNSALWVSMNGGDTWAVRGSVPTSTGRTCLASSFDMGRVMVGTNGGLLYVTPDLGLTWSSMAGPGARVWRCVAMSADGRVLLGGASSATNSLWVSPDAGATWSAFPGSVASGWVACAVSNDGRVLIAVAANGTVWISRNTGVTWEQDNVSGSWGACAASGDGRILFVGGALDECFISYDEGYSWSVFPDFGISDVKYAKVSDDGRVIVVSANNGLLRACSLIDPCYEMPPLGVAAADIPAVVVQAPDLAAQAMAMGLLDAAVLDTETGGNGCIYGSVELYAQSGNIPLPRRVRLHRSRDGLLVREAWSDAQGNYRFDGISDRYKYDVIAWDHEGLQQSVVANDLTPESMQ